ncbi:secretion protein EccK [Mycobacterium sp. JS623]|uniref:secretion protein EccK n=1 Tax=Mycobacterium sp. JS623 TaxID=212767 RepID=UPI001E622AF1|nr:secretion protein EccK [Mycobacterium sp. JS623]
MGAPAPVPVSAARAERDAIAAAATAGALRRQSAGGSDPLQLARRIGAALNAEPNIDFGFFWVTALTQDGQIVVANSYGLGYIPDGVNLPDQVRMASADESIPLGERAKWTTYPILAVQGWAQHHNLRLRAVVATEDQFKNFDPGTPKVTLRSDDIPDSGKMQGRNRLAVIAPEAAARLASVSASGLSELLPPASSDTNPPVDETSNLWFEVMKPMMSTNPERGIAHLEAFVKYADHAQEQALYRAHTAPDAAAQRGAIADWVYWQHLSVLTSDALAGSAAK